MVPEQAVVREFMAGYPGQLLEEPFVDFSTTRNFALRVSLARRDYDWLCASHALLPHRLPGRLHAACKATHEDVHKLTPAVAEPNRNPACKSTRPSCACFRAQPCTS